MNNINPPICSLRKNLRIIQTDLSLWRQLSQFHYRQLNPGAVEKVFAIVPDNKPNPQKYSSTSRIPIGVIIYAMPVPSIALRNRATAQRYTGLTRQMSLRLLNEELRCISRIVIHPQYRGIGLASHLVRQTLHRAGTIFVEALAVMGNINPFFERAGMTRYHCPPSPDSQRMISAFANVNINQDKLIDTTTLTKEIANLNTDNQRLIALEMKRFIQRFIKNKDHLTKSTWKPDQGIEALQPYIKIVVNHVMSNPAYFLWKKNTEVASPLIL